MRRFTTLNPALVLGSFEGRQPLDPEKAGNMRERMGVDVHELSPIHHVRRDLPPTIIFHGKADTTVHYWTAEVFADAMQKAHNRCELVGYEGQTHGFFNYGRNDGASFQQTVAEMDRFLVSLGYLGDAADVSP